MDRQDPNHHTSSSVNRRSFFRKIIYRGLESAEQIGKQAVKPIHDAFSLPSTTPSPPATVHNTLLRPPGAVSEDKFYDLCDRTGQCAAACPANCIIIDPDTLGGTPHVIAKNSPCVICDDLACMAACPTGALEKIERGEIQMGFAAVHQIYCLRPRGEDCRLCVERCPIGEAALRIDENNRVEVTGACTGCGVCEYACPTSPAAIEVTPARGLRLPQG